MSAGGSPTGADFAAKQADIQFLNMQTLEGGAALVASLRANAWEKYQRRPQIMTCLYIICRDTEAEARDYFHYAVRDKGDRQAARNMMDALIPNATFQITPDVLDHVCAGFGGIPLIGTPAQIVEALSNLADLGLDGAAISWINYDEGIKQFHEVLNPLLRAAGLRK
jgi:FMNH2-dependent dimethyl sulfone monooxygenase